MTNNAWEKTKIGNLIRLDYGKGLPESKRLGGNIPVYGSNGIVGYHNESLIKGKGIIVGRKGTIGHIEWVTRDFWPIDTTYYIPESDKYDLLWLYYLLKSLNLKNLNRATGVPGLNREDVYNLVIALPERKIQQKIAAILGSVDEAIHNTNKIIKKTEDLKTGLMSELLTKGIGHNRFKQTKYGQIPQSWGLQQLSTVAKVVDSLHQTPRYSEQGVAMVRVVDIKAGELNLSNCVSVSEEVYKLFTKNHIPIKGDIVISRVGSFGVFSFANTEEKFCLGQNTAIISPAINNKYLYYALQSPITSQQVQKLVVGSNQKTLSLKHIKELLLPIPPTGEQDLIADILSSLDSKLVIDSKKQKSLTSLKKGLMEDIFSQKVQVD